MNTFYRKQRPVRSRKKQLGVAAVEFTIALPLLLFLLFVAGEMGRLLHQYNTLTKSVEDGARLMSRSLSAAYSNGTVADLTVNAEELVRYGTTEVTDTTLPLLPGLEASTNPVSIDTDPATNEVIVTVTYTYDPVVFPDSLAVPLWQNILLAIPLTATVTMPVI